MTQTTNTGLQTKALTVNFTVNQWTARKHDKKITKEVEDTHNAHDAGRYNKMLIAKKELEKIQKTAGAARLFHYEQTLPWSNNGDRLLPTANHMNYVKEMSRFKNEFENEVAAFIADYGSIVEDAKIRLNGMFNANDYPHTSEIREKFGFTTCFMPLPDTDFRLELTDTEVNTIRQEVENTYKERIESAVKDTWQRIKEQLTHMQERLTTVKEDGKPAIFNNSLFTNLEDIIALLPRLNVTGSAEINQICEDMKVLVIDPEKVRTSAQIRSRKAEEVTAILNKFEAFF